MKPMPPLKKNQWFGLRERLHGDDWGWLDMVYDRRLWVEALNSEDKRWPETGSTRMPTAP